MHFATIFIGYFNQSNFTVQGTIPGPFLFVVYVNDLPNCFSHCQPRMYPDDTLILSFGHIIICNNATFS